MRIMNNPSQPPLILRGVMSREAWPRDIDIKKQDVNPAF